MDKYYKKSRKIMVALVAILVFVIFISEDISTQIISTAVFSLLTLIVTSISKPISKQMIAVGDKIKSKALKVIYYISLLPLSFLFFIIVIGLSYSVFANSDGNQFALIITLLLYAITYVLSFVHCIQTLIVLGLRFNDKMKQKLENNQE